MHLPRWNTRQLILWYRTFFHLLCAEHGLKLMRFCIVRHVLPYDYIAKPRAGWVESLILKTAHDNEYA